MKRWASLLFGLILAACSRNEEAGNTMETENSLALRVLDGSQKGLSAMRVRVRPAWFVAGEDSTESDAWCDTTSDAKGFAYCPDLPEGNYVLETWDDSLGAAVEVFHLGEGSGEALPVYARPLGTLQGQVELPAQESYAWVQVYGTERAVRTDSLGHFEFKALPPGTLRVRALVSNRSLGETMVQVRPAQLTRTGYLPPPSAQSEDPLTWRHERALPLSSLVSDWMVPLKQTAVLTLRLDSTFPFAETMKGGEDLRVRDSWGNTLDLQSALWDSAGKRALLRVKLPSAVLASGEPLLLQWGHEGALAYSTPLLWQGVTDSLALALQSLLVDDFEKGSPMNAFEAPLKAKYWYIRSSDSTVATIPTEDEDIKLALSEAGGGRSGHAMHVNFSAPDYQWALLGCALGSAPRSLAGLDSIVFWLRGTGRFSVAFDNLVDGKKAWMHGDLDSVWTRHRVRPQDFLPPDSLANNVGWQAVRDSVTNLTFFMRGQGDFWIDDIRLYGVNRDDLR